MKIVQKESTTYPATCATDTAGRSSYQDLLSKGSLVRQMLLRWLCCAQRRTLLQFLQSQGTVELHRCLDREVKNRKMTSQIIWETKHCGPQVFVPLVLSCLSVGIVLKPQGNVKLGSGFP